MIKDIEEKTKHDVKAIEYFIREILKKTTLKDIENFIHFGLTSEDINNIAIRLMLRDTSEKIILPELKRINTIFFNEYKKYKNLAMLARTHGQPAVPTTLGKEILVFNKRIEFELEILRKTKFRAKINGAVGNYNALNFVYPKINWKNFSKIFLRKFQLNTNLYTTQIAPYEDIIYFFQTIQRINGIILDFNQDIWRYISDNYFIQNSEKNEVGSSTMPQKINPINFENSEGNLIIANSLIEGFSNKLSISRLQRDLSGSTISRNFGVMISHSLIAYKNTAKGLEKLNANKEKIELDLNADYSILSEAIQIYLKKNEIPNGYELVKDLTKGRNLNKSEYQELVKNLPLDKRQINQLLNLTPSDYLGLIA
jgi:adenylosuccinate lyase